MTGTFVDYALPSAAEIPSFETDRTETPSPVNTLGVKGVGEAGTIARDAGDRQRRDRRAAPARRDVHQHAATRRCACGRRSRRRRGRRGTARDRAGTRARRAGARPGLRADGAGRRAAVIPPEFDYVGAGEPRRRHPAAARGRRGRQAARRRALADPADEAAAGGARAAGRPAQGARAARHPARERPRPDRRDDHAPRRSSSRPSSGSSPGRPRTIADPQVRNRGTLGGSLAHGDPASDMPAVLLAPEGSVTRAGAGRRSARSPPPTCSRTT